MVLSLCTVSNGCSVSPLEVPSPSFAEVFDLVEVVTLEEAPGDSVAEVGILVEAEPRGFMIADGLLPRVRRYAEDGSLLAAFGRFGRGPWELERVIGLMQTPVGRVLVTDGSQLRVTVLNEDLTPDTLVSVPHVIRAMRAMNDGSIIFTGIPDNVAITSFEQLAARPRIHRLADGAVLWSRWTSPEFAKPYVMNLSGLPWTATGDSVFVMAGVAYPATILDVNGDSVGTIGTPSPRFRPIPDIPEGYFATQQSGPRVADLLRSFDTVDRLDVIHSDHLVFTIGRLDHLRPYPPFKRLHTRLEIYNRHTGEKLYEDVPLPAGAKVLGGGRYLYLLLNPDIPPWRIAKYRLATAAQE